MDIFEFCRFHEKLIEQEILVARRMCPERGKSIKFPSHGADKKLISVKKKQLLRQLLYTV